MLALVALLAPVLCCAVGTNTSVTVDPSAAGLPFDGNGGLSAGASSRLLYDYAQPQRDEILDYLYKPNFGANLHVCKVEIGGDTQSTDGTEPSHMHSRDDMNCDRGYEFWLMGEAKKRNHDVITYGLAWGTPGWINNQTGYYGPDQVTYQVNWLKCARDSHGIDVDYLGLWNERPWGTPDYVKTLRKAMDAEGFQTKLVLGDGGMPNVMDYGNDTEFMNAFESVGLHYPCEERSLRGQGGPLIAAGKKVWASEDWWTEAEYPGATCWAKLFNQNFIRMNLTSTISWSTVWSVYPVLDVFEGSGDTISGDGFWGPGLVYAWQPWSGHYVVPPTVWASAHTTQFAQPGWKMTFNGAGNLAGGGSYVTYISPDGSDFSMVIETGKAACAHCGYTPSTWSTAPQTLTVTVASALASAHSKVELWHTDETAMFIHTGSLPIGADSKVTLTVQPESIYTISTTTGQAKGSTTTPPPPSAPFPSTYATDFDSVPTEGLGRYWADQCGSFQAMPALNGGKGQAYMQRVVERPGVNRWATNLKQPLTALGNWNTSDSSVSVDLLVKVGGNGSEGDEGGKKYRRASNGTRPTTVGTLPPATAAAVAAAAVGGRYEALGEASVAALAFKYEPGRITGGAWETSKTLSSLSSAESYCESQPQCNAITFANKVKSPPGNQVYWFTSLATVVPSQAGWQSYVVSPPRPAPPPSPPPRPLATPLGEPWAGLCGRVSKAGIGSTSAVCIEVNGTEWQVVEKVGDGAAHGTVKLLGSGLLASSAAAGAAEAGGIFWVPVELAFSGTNVQATIDGKAVVLANPTTAAVKGMFALESGWNEAQFDNFAFKST